MNFTVTGQQKRALADSIDRGHREMMADIKRRDDRRFAAHEVSFETCSFFDERHSDGSGGVMEAYRSFPEPIRNRLDEACRTRLMVPRALHEMVDEASNRIAWSGGSSNTKYEEFRGIINDLNVAREMRDMFPSIREVSVVHVASTIHSAVGGLCHRKAEKDRSPIRGALSVKEQRIAAAVAYIGLTYTNREVNELTAHREFKDADGNKCKGTVLLSQALWQIIRENPELADKIVYYLNTRGMQTNAAKAVEPLRAFINEDLSAALMDGWV